MPIHYKSCVLFVKDIKKSDSFYQNILNQEIEFDFGANIGYKSGLAIWKIREDHEIANVYESENNSSKIEVYFESEDLDTLKATLQSEEVELLHDIKTEPWGQRTIRFFDSDHHLIEVGEPLKTFITRIFKETKSVKETAERTGTPIEMVKGFIAE